MPRTFYGMPAYAKDGKVICLFQAKSKFKVRICIDQLEGDVLGRLLPERQTDGNTT